MPRCKHDKGNIQQFTEICLDCGHNIYESEDEYEASLKRDIYELRKQLQQERIADLEKTKDELESELQRRKNKNEDNSGGW